MNTPNPHFGFKFWPLFINLLITLSIGGVASYSTVPQIDSWYLYLHKPTFNPPNWLFGPVWTCIYIMIAIAAYLVWQRRYEYAASFAKARNVYIIQLLLNFSWSIVFFGLHQIFAALVIIVLLLIIIVLNLVFFGRINKIAAWLFVPYLLWVSFATVLNTAIYLLNR